MRFLNIKGILALILLFALSAILAGCCCVGGVDDDDIDLNLSSDPDPVPPVAVVSADPDLGVEPLEVQLDASASYDPDGTIVQYDWDFDADGTFDLMDGGAMPVFTFDSADLAVSFVETGVFHPVVKVTDNDGLTDEASTTVTVGELVPPVAAISATPNNGVEPLEVTLDATASYDDDGTIVQYDWDFDGDGTFDLMDGGATTTHTYATSGGSSVSFVETGQFHPAVRVTDDDGLTDEASTTVTTGELVPPTADLVPTPATGDTPLDVTWDASGSTDSDGTIVQYDWDMDNDGTYEIEDGGDSQSATYDPGGIYTVGVRVTDNDGLTDETTADVDVNNPPVADLVPVPDGGVAPLDVTWDASGSTDSDGTIVQYDWDMDNDGTYEITDGGDNQPATYPDFGTYTVGVRVTDDDGATDETSASTTVLVPPLADLQADPDTGDAPISVDWDASGSTDADGTIVQYDWDMDNDGTYEITDGGDLQTANYPVGGLYTVGVMVTDNDGLTDETTLTIDINNPPTAVLTHVTTWVPNNESYEIVWDASASFDTDGTIVRYDWDMDNDGTFEIIDGPVTQTTMLFVEFPELPVVGLRVTDDDGAQDQTTDMATIPPFAIIDADTFFGFTPLTVNMDGSTYSYDPDGGPIVQYDWDMDNDGTYEIIDGGPTQTYTFTVEGNYTVMLRVTDDEGEVGEGPGFFTVVDPPA